MLGHRVLTSDDYVGILKRRGWIIAIPVVVLPFIAYALTFLIPPQFLSQTLVLVESPKIPDSYVKPVVSSSLDDRLASMKEQILSRSRLEPIISRYNLYADKHMSMEDRIDTARTNIDIKPITSEIAHSGGLPGFFISFKANDPHTAQLICGEITSLFVGENLRSREASAQGTTNFLKSQLDDAKRSLDEQDAKLAAFQRANSGRLPEEATQNINMLSTLNTQLEASTQALSRMEQDKSYQESMLAQQLQQQQQVRQAAAGAKSGISAPEAQQQDLQVLLTQEADLSAHYTADYPDLQTVRRKISDLQRQIARSAATPAPTAPTSTAPSRFDNGAVQQLRAQIKAAEIGIDAKRKEQGEVQASIRMYQGRIEETPQVEQQYKQLTRDYQTAQAFYDDLLRKMNDVNMATALEKRQEGEQFRMMDEPNLPDRPFSPKRGAYVLAGIGGGVLLGLLIVAFIEYKDTTLRNERDVWAFTKLPTLAVIGDTADEVPQSGGISSLLPFRSSKLLPQARG